MSSVTSVSMIVGQRANLTAGLNDSGGHAEPSTDPSLIVWSVDQPTIVSIGALAGKPVTGAMVVVTGLAPGVAVITAAYKNGSSAFTDTITVTVSPPTVVEMDITQT